MSDIYFTISLDEAVNNINDANIPEELKDIYNESFLMLSQDPFNVDSTISLFEDYYEGLVDIPKSVVSSIEQSITPYNTVVRLDMDGDILQSNSKAVFSSTKEECKNIIGSVERVGVNRILVADSTNKRAIIVNTQTNKIIWEYKSDRYIIDAHLVPREESLIQLDDKYSSKDYIINKDKIVIWENNMSVPLSIYSGDIGDIDISMDFDENLYGDDFQSPILEDGDRWAFKFEKEGEYLWFSYPNGLRGKIIVSDCRVSSNDCFIILESDCMNSPYTSKVIKVDGWGNKLWEFNKHMVRPRDARPLLNGGVLISV